MAGHVGVSVVMLPADVSVQESIESWLATQPEVPGIIVLVRTGDREVGACAGFADRNRIEPLSSAHVFRIASNTKTFVAVATMCLVDRGVLAFDDPVAKILPRDVRSLLVRRYDVAAITLRMLLQHTSGIASHDARSHDGTSPFLNAVQATPTHRWTAVEQIAFSVEHFAPTHPPGGPMLYTDTGYIVLGQILEHITGATLSSVVREQCRLDQLGLPNTWWERFEPQPSPPPPRTRVQLGDQDWEDVDCSIDLYGGGGLVSSVADLTTWWRALFHNEILQPETLAAMLSPLAASNESHGNAALGLFRRSVAERMWWTHSGYWGSIVLHDLTADLTLTAFRNQSEVRTAALEPTYAAIVNAVLSAA
jgi:D-alanyl-D-alanine carboxypeptidase